MNGKPLKVTIEGGGLRTRIREETEYRPGPMDQMGTEPIGWLAADNEL